MKIIDSRVATEPPAAARAHRRARLLRIGALAGPIAAALLVAGCGGGSSAGSGVAHLNRSTTANSSTKSSTTASGLAFAQCMRSHGVPAFPDSPSSGGANQLPPSINPNSSSFQAARKDCKSLAPISRPSAAQSSKTIAAALKFATCMQNNGVPNFPDPKTVNNGTAIQESLGKGVDPNSPAFQRAQQKCNSLVPAPAQAGGS